MLAPFFRIAMLSPGRQSAFRWAVALHAAATLAACYAAMPPGGAWPAHFLGHAMLVMGIVEGAVLVGWRLTQMPKSQALEFLLVSPVQPRRVFWAEAAVGLSRLALVTASGVPVLLLYAAAQRGALAAYAVPGVPRFELENVVALTLVPYTFGALTGLGLTAWAYESLSVRRVGQVISFIAVMIYLVVGVLAGEKLGEWLTVLPTAAAQAVTAGVWGSIENNPFLSLQAVMSAGRLEIGTIRVDEPLWVSWERLATGWAVAAGLTVLCLARAGWRFKGHFHDRHYRPQSEVATAGRGGPGERPLSWWAVRRVMEYSGRTNLYLAGGFCAVYAVYILAGDQWPAWLGRGVFEVFERAGGVAALTTGLVTLAAVPAAFQYGLWDSSSQNRLRRLELLLLSDLNERDYYDAAASAAWRRGRGYFWVAGGLWLAGVAAGRLTVTQALAAAAAGVLLWAFAFAVGFRAFGRGAEANGQGSTLTLGLPLAVAALLKAGLPVVAAFLPPGAVYLAQTDGPHLWWLAGPVLTGAAALALSQSARHTCERDLRRWYDANTGRGVVG